MNNYDIMSLILPYYMKLLLQKILVNQIIWSLNFGRVNMTEKMSKNTNLTSAID